MRLYKILWCLLCSSSIIIAHHDSIITNVSQNDGFGSQFHNIIATVIFAEINKKQYVYTPFQKMDHNYNSETNFIAKKEWLINFMQNFKIRTGSKVISQRNCKQFLDKNIEECANSLVLQKIKNIFRANKRLDKYFKKGTFNIAIHMRRPNSHDCRIMGCDTSNIIFLKIVDRLRLLFSSERPIFHIYSQGYKKGFEMFQSADVRLHLNGSIEDSFISMAIADVLVTDRSCYSYTAGLLSDGIVYYIPFWHSPLPQWISASTLITSG